MGKYSALFEEAAPRGGKYSALFEDAAPSVAEPGGADKASKIASMVSTGAGLAAPALAITGTPAIPALGISAAAGAPALGVLGGLAGGMAAGAGADALLNAVPQLKQGLKAGSEALRASIPEPRHQSVGLNMAQNVFQEITDPRAGIANLLEALPSLASTYAGYKGAKGGEAVMMGLRNLLMGAPKVAAGQEGAALLNKLSEQFGTPGAKGKMNTGELRQALGAGRAQLGMEKGDVERAAFANAKQPENAPAIVQKAIQDAMARQGVPLGKPELASSPSAARDLLQTSETIAPKVGNVEELNAMQRQLAARGAEARKPSSPVSHEAPYYESAAQNIKGEVSKLLPENLQKPLEIANKDFSAFAELQKMARKATKGGEFSPERLIAEWKTMEPRLKAQRFKPDTIAALDQLFEQGGPGIIPRLVQATKSVANTNFGTAAQQLFSPSPKVPVRFNAPESRLDPEMVQKLGIAGATLAQNAKRLSKVK